MSDLADLFPGFASEWISTSRGRIFARVGGKGPPLLLLHGYPQTHVMWHKVAPALADRFTLVIPDLPGYGWSDVPKTDADHTPFTKRAMAQAMIEVMEKLGHVHFALAGHDRGGRVAYRLARAHRLLAEDGPRLCAPRLSLGVPGAAVSAAGKPDRIESGRLFRPHIQELGALGRAQSVRSARRGALSHRVPRSAAHPCRLRGLSRGCVCRFRTRQG